MEQGKKEASNNKGDANKPRPNNKRRRNNRRRPNNKQQAKGAKGQEQKQTKSQGPNKGQKAAPKKSGSRSNNRNRRRRPQGRNRRSGTSHLKGEDFVIVKYLNLLEQHIMARKKYFENFDRVGEKQKEKLEKNFIDTQKTFLDFKGRLKPEELEIFEKKFESLKMDTTYANNHELPLGEVAPEVSVEEIEDPHYLQTQIQADYSEDTEESMGSLEDYKAYKGL
ncbi:hypothetical protein DAY19_11055 [Halobacteriovorax vibrionivorans]|uniref:Uncharacterized protein n=1 Tax=Halobacteriovorax vibrionivorans TaxID=2152716 RepID=A0ABY0ICX6_9BACT|nr:MULTISPECIES: hypothetical protein [Halobacteriovorax]RZF20517.1 hypothetical protein DAY19_11055 [Halobacteriovorax vibrionivorans]TGD47430.1 hypothetical protein EP118_07585 [Halobacteriovorax sp. Y22]